MRFSNSKIVPAFTILEKSLKISVAFGLRMSILLASWLFVYMSSGYLVNSFGWFNPGYEVLSMESDPIFIFSGLLTSVFIAQTSGSLLLYQFLVGSGDENTAITILMGYIGLGCGAALLRLMLPPAIQLILSAV